NESAEVQYNAEVQHNTEVQHNAVDLIQSDENSAEYLHTTIETDTDRLYSDEEQPNNLNDEDTP
ncbi:19988_t:CDS:1, partial [Racocetra persica]